MSAIDEEIKLIREIINNKISKKEVEKTIKDMEEKYGEETFIKITYTEKPKPWSEEYYKELKNLAHCGLLSKEFILHLVTVRDELKKRKYIKYGIIVLGIVAILILCSLFFIKK